MARPIPVPDARSQPYWDAADQRRLVAQRCVNCTRYQHPPQRICLICGSAELEFVPVSGKGRIYSYTTINDTRVVSLIPLQPFPAVAVELDESPDLLLVTNLVGAAAAQIAIGARVEVLFEELGDGRLLPQFKLSPGQP